MLKVIIVFIVLFLFFSVLFLNSKEVFREVRKKRTLRVMAAIVSALTVAVALMTLFVSL